jgi:2-polyprenyl-3-methyl-5-hydroxy-6-metoxy-1,4-benzoquinol methylase
MRDIMTYQEQLRGEAELWGTEAERMAQQMPPDWRYHQALPHNRVLHGDRINELLSRIHPGMTVLELGCASGWLSLAMAQQGAAVTGYDISEKSLAIAQDYYAQIADDVPGQVQYAVADLNHLNLPANMYDVVVVKGVLHHLVNMPEVIAQVKHTLKPGGLFWIHDVFADEGLMQALLAGGLMVLLPTEVSYQEKLRGLVQFGTRAPQRIKASMEAEGLSPFEGAGRDHNWLHLVQQHFSIERQQPVASLTGYLTAQVTLPQSIGLPFLKTLRVIEENLLSAGILQASSMTVYARK